MQQKSREIGLVAVLLALVAFSCAGEHYAAVPRETVHENPGFRGGANTLPWADSVLATLSLEEKVGQMVMVTAPAVFQSDSTEAMRRLASLVRGWHVGGVAILHGTVYGACMMADRLQELAPVPLLISADFEHGLAMRYARGTDLPDAMAFGATRDSMLSYLAGKITGEEARTVGVRMNLAPVVDLNTNPDNPVINTRSYGSDPALVAELTRAYSRGLSDAGVLATAKHFPGHGPTSEDSHLQLPVVHYERARLDSIEFAPFRALIADGIPAVMVGHIAVPAVDPSGLPASLSPLLTKGVLRETMHFRGLIITDAMGMAGARVVPPERGAVMAVKAGADILLLTEDEYAALAAVRDAVLDHEISMARIDSSVRRILLAKQRLGLPENRFVSPAAAQERIGTPSHWKFARTVASRAMTLLRNRDGLLPLKPFPTGRTVSLILTESEDSRTEIDRPDAFGNDEPTGSYFTRLLHRRHPEIETVRLSPTSTAEEQEHALEVLRHSDLALVSVFVGVHTSSGHIGMPPHFAPLVDALNSLQTPMIVVSFGDPYLVREFPAASAVLCGYSDSEPTAEAVVDALTGDQPIGGHLPVPVSPEYPEGYGLSLGEAPPPGSDTLVLAPPSASFDTVNDLMNQAVRDSVFPGAQLVVLRGHEIVLRKCYGRYTYDLTSQAVDDSTLYDLASLTKVIATTTAVMRLYDRGEIALDAPAARYLQQFQEKTKRDITIRELLQHRAGFPPFRRLWTMASTPTAALDSAIATPLVAPPGDSTIYSDISMISMGAIVRHVADRPLDEFDREEIFQPLGMNHTCFNPPPRWQHHSAPTEYDSTWRKRQIVGTVHDENAALLGGVSGHAGLFSTASDLARFALMMMNQGRAYGHEIYSHQTYETFLGSSQNPGDRWLGWDKRSPEGSSSGSLFSSASFGHTGFTGTSIWIDPQKRVAVILLANRVYPTRRNLRILHFRPVLHNAVMRALGEGEGK
jgi:beta-N-acetylhexosaminidase